jgi:hypothetical protein
MMRRRSTWGEALGDIPFELVGKVASARSVAEAGDVERSAAAARHVCNIDVGIVSRIRPGVAKVAVNAWSALGYVVVDGRFQGGQKDLEGRCRKRLGCAMATFLAATL